MLADEQRRQRRSHQRRGAARDRIDLPHVAGAIGLDQSDEIEQMDQHRGDKPRPRRRLGNSKHERKRQRAGRGSDPDQDRRG
jgi:hypothetical protein